jgi:adenylate cyclase
MISRMQSPPDEPSMADQRKIYEAKGQEIEQEAQAARALINAIIDDTSTHPIMPGSAGSTIGSSA